ncbi:hypothetical protein GCM10010495_61350 [Kitasatospora herbaricolor]|nr:hypothetical protein GCM10010495_61350 [Kitasatospora herbaricolor]
MSRSSISIPRRLSDDLPIVRTRRILRWPQPHKIIEDRAGGTRSGAVADRRCETLRVADGGRLNPWSPIP